MPVSEETYERVALEDPEGLWEAICPDYCRKAGAPCPAAKTAIMRQLLEEFDQLR